MIPRRLRPYLDEHLEELLRGAGVALGIKVAGAGLALGFNIVLARVLGPDGAGLYFLAVTVTMLASVLGRVGLDNALLRFTAGHASIGDWAAVSSIYRRGVGLGGFASVAMGVFVFLLAPSIAGRIFDEPELAGPLRIMALAVPLLSLSILHAELLKGLKRILESQIVQGVAIPGFSLIALAVLGPVFGLAGAAWAYVVATASAGAIGYSLWRARTSHALRSGKVFPFRKLLDSSVPLLWIAVLSLVMSWASTVLLGIWGTAREVGIFSVAQRTALLTSFVLFAVNSIAAPKFSALYTRGELTALDSTARRAAGIMTLLAVPVLLVFILVPELVLGLFGGEFRAGADILVILAIGQFVNVVTGSVSYLLMMSGHERLLRRAVFAAALLNLGLNVALIPPLGILGAAVATASSTVFLNLSAVVLVYSRLSILTLPIPGGGHRPSRGP